MTLDTSQINIYKESASASIASLFGSSINLLIGIILAYFLLTDEVGLFYFYLAIMYLFTQGFVSVGKAVRKKASSREKQRPQLLYSAIVILIITYSILFFIFILLYYPINTYFTVNVSIVGLVITYTATIIKGFNYFMSYYYAGCGYPSSAEKIKNYVGKIGTVVFLSLSLAIFDEVYIAILSYGIGNIVSILMMIYFAPTQYYKPEISDIRKILEFSKWSIINTVSEDIYQRYDVIILSILVSATAISYYDNTLRIVFIGTAFAIGIRAASNIKMSGLYEINKQIKPTIKKSFNIAPTLVIAILIISLLEGIYILETLFGSEYKNAIYYLIFLSIFQIFTAYKLQFESIFNAIDKPNKITKVNIVSIATNIILSPIIVVFTGGIGVVYATIISEIIRFTYFQYKLKQEIHTIIFPKETQYLYVIAVITIIIGYTLNILISVSVLNISIALLIYFSLVYKYCEHNQKYLNEMKNILKSRM